ncbi:hypothetical protein Thiowin_02292 [Thiorhodovibrio winogradskyi]|uniref:Uncharacterized protein n=1 Tax=Thiorhodovibrio winogradskyi TaxID=77007 RepID=A0ABZ0SB67_9GAMM
MRQGLAHYRARQHDRHQDDGDKLFERLLLIFQREVPEMA